MNERGEIMSNDTTRAKLESVKDDVHDGVDEAKHRAQAASERASRAIAGDNQSLGDKIVSTVKEAGHNLAADFDKAKREARHDDATTTDKTTDKE
jgi:hypothetical protein